MKIGFIINPISGMGGRVGLKGTDNLAELAASLGEEPVSLVRAEQALQSIEEEDDMFFLTCSGKMGESVLEKTRFSYEVIYDAPERTTAEDTKKAALKMLGSGCNLLLFSGGDGTAGDIVSVVDKKIPVLGIPAGVKIFSPVFCITPAECGRIVSTFTETSVRDVLDIDEDAYRNNELNVRITGDFFLHPEDALDEIEESITGFDRTVSEEEIALNIQKTTAGKDVQMIGISPESIALLIREALK